MALKEKRSEATVGLFLLVGLAILGTLVIKFGKLGDSRMDGSYMVHISFNDASGLIKGSEVRMGGARIGKIVQTPELQNDLTVKVSLKLDQRIKIDTASTFQIQSISLIGDKMIVIGRPKAKSGEFLQDGDEIQGDGAGGLDAIQSDAESVARDARVLMKDARTTLLKVDSSIDDIRSVAGRLAETVERVNTDLFDQENMASIKRSLKNIEEVTASFKGIGEKIQPTFQEARKTIAKINTAVDTAEQTFADASKQLKSIEPALADIPETLASFKKAAKQAESTMNTAEKTVLKIGKGNGLLASLADDKELDTDTKQFVKNLKHYGILRYRDDATADLKAPKENRYRSSSRR